MCFVWIYGYMDVYKHGIYFFTFLQVYIHVYGHISFFMCMCGIIQVVVWKSLVCQYVSKLGQSRYVCMLGYIWRYKVIYVKCMNISMQMCVYIYILVHIYIWFLQGSEQVYTVLGESIVYMQVYLKVHAYIIKEISRAHTYIYMHKKYIQKKDTQKSTLVTYPQMERTRSHWSGENGKERGDAT